MSFAHSFIQSGVGFIHQPASSTDNTARLEYSPLLADELEDDEEDILDDEDEGSQPSAGASQGTARVSIVHKVKQLIALSNEEIVLEANQKEIAKIENEIERMIRMFYLHMKVQGHLTEFKNDYFVA